MKPLDWQVYLKVVDCRLGKWMKNLNKVFFINDNFIKNLNLITARPRTVLDTLIYS